MEQDIMIILIALSVVFISITWIKYKEHKEFVSEIIPLTYENLNDEEIELSLNYITHQMIIQKGERYERRINIYIKYLRSTRLTTQKDIILAGYYLYIRRLNGFNADIEVMFNSPNSPIIGLMIRNIMPEIERYE